MGSAAEHSGGRIGVLSCVFRTTATRHYDKSAPRGPFRGKTLESTRWRDQVSAPGLVVVLPSIGGVENAA